MRILVVGQLSPWTTVIGARLRLLHVIEALAGLGEVDVYVVANQDDDVAAAPPPDSPVRRHRAVKRPPSRRARRWAEVAAARHPTELAGRDYSGVRADFTAWADDPYDLVWYSRPVSWVALHPALDGVPAIIDLDDLEDLKAGARLDAVAPRGWRARLAAIRGRHDQLLWSRLQRRISAAASHVVVCSELDRQRLGAENAAVVPNGYDDPARPLGREQPGAPPTILLQGNLLYRPNVVAAGHLVREVLPLVRRSLPEVRLRLVGRPAPAVEALHDPPGVMVTGFVPSMEAELAQADVVVVPVTFGGGTRIKILEAFAHGIPVVSTRIGAEGIDAADGRHLLLADGAGPFADACVRALTDPDLRRRLAAESRALFLERYRWEAAMDRVRDLAQRTVASTRA